MSERGVHFPVATGRQTHESQYPDVFVLETYGLDSHRLVEKRTGEDLPFAEGYRASFRPLIHLISCSSESGSVTSAERFW